MISTLPEPQRHPAWPDIEHMLRPALSEPGHELFDPSIDVVWIAYEGQTIFAAATSRLRNDGTAELRLAGGVRHRDWVAALDEGVTEWARLCGALSLVMRGRKGWGRYARPFGWVVSGFDDGQQIFTKEL